MFARVVTYSGDVDQLIPAYDYACTYLKELDGFSIAYFCVNRSRSKALSMQLWESEEALDASAMQVRQLRASAAEAAGATTESVMEYEVAFTVQRPGAMVG
jgi:type IV pilus biogenesis protein CpaD/CtpE